MNAPNVPNRGPTMVGNTRLAFLVVTFAFEATVLGITARLANVFLPNIHHDFLIFALVASSFTIFCYLLLLNWSQARIEVPVFFVLMVLWLAMGAWSADVIGPIECFPLAGQTVPTKNGNMSSREYCYDMKVIEAFSWMTFVLLFIWFFIVLFLANDAKARGNWNAWDVDVRMLPWFNEGQMPYQQMYPYGGQQQMYQPGGAYQLNGQYVVNQAPGHSVVIQRDAHGNPVSINQVPGTVVNA